MHACMHAYMHPYMHTCRHAYMHTCIHAYMHRCIHAYMRTCVHAYAYMRTCIRAYMHTCISLSLSLYIYNISKCHTYTHPSMHDMTWLQAELESFTDLRIEWVRATSEVQNGIVMEKPEDWMVSTKGSEVNTRNPEISSMVSGTLNLRPKNNPNGRPCHWKRARDGNVVPGISPMIWPK